MTSVHCSTPQEIRAQEIRARIERHIDELPVLPSVIVKLMSLNPRQENYFDEVKSLIEADPTFTARVLAAANSAASAPRAPITTVRAAVSRLGSMSASNLIISFAVTRVFVPRDEWERSLWKHAIQVALAARLFAEKVHDPDINPEEAYTCAILHDVGRFVMLQEAPEQLREIDEGNWHSPDELLSKERAICGMTHTELGAMACQRWGIPDIITAVVRNHHLRHNPEDRSHVGKLTALIHFADVALFPSSAPGTPSYDTMNDEEIRRMLVANQPYFLSLTPSCLRHVIQAIIHSSEEVERMVGLHE